MNNKKSDSMVQKTSGLKTDEEYGYHITLKDGRPFPEGNRIHGVNLGATDVEMLRAIMDLYIPSSSVEDLEKFTSHKMDFSVNVLDTLTLICKDKYKYANDILIELERQETDIAHKILKPILTGQQLTVEEKLKIYDEQEKLFITRRHVKDTVLVLKIMAENFENMRNYILGMNKRRFLPSSDKYSGMEDFSIQSQIDAKKQEN